MGCPGVASGRGLPRAARPVTYAGFGDRPDEIPATFVVPVDGSDPSRRALTIAATYARRFDADLILTATAARLDGTAPSETPMWLDQAIASTRQLRTRSIVTQDDTASAIAAVIAGAAAPIVSMATRGHDTVRTAALGSVAQQVLQAVEVPVLLVGGHCAAQPISDGPLVVCHDGSPAADAILAPARVWARALGSPIVLVHVLHPPDLASGAAPPAAIASAIDFLDCAASAERVHSSHPGGAIRDLVHELDASIVALSTRGRTGLARTPIGSVATWITRERPGPLLVRRPTPLKRFSAPAGHEVR
jgi:nucleotide-binding universal stress UspA family protein